MDKFKKGENGFNYVYETTLKPFEERIVKLPSVSSNKRGINDIGWVATGEVALYGTLSARPDKEDIWQQIIDRDEINKTVSALKVVNGGTECKLIIRVIMN